MQTEIQQRTGNDSVRAERGISLEVWNARPYTWWEPSDLTPIAEAYAGLTKPQVSFMKKLARQHPGWIIHRHAVPHAPHVWPEIRPDGLVRTGPPVMHWHGTQDPESVVLPAKDNGEPGEWYPVGGWRELKRGSEAWQAHCDRVNKDLGVDPTHEDAHENVMEPHTHENNARVLWGTPLHALIHPSAWNRNSRKFARRKLRRRAATRAKYRRWRSP